MSTSFALFRQHRIADLCTAQRLLHNFWQHKSLPAANDVTAGSIGTPIAAMLLTYLLVVLLTPQGRKRTWELLEAVLATLLMLCLLVAVLGMPVGAAYLVLKATAYFLRALLGLPVISRIASAVTSIK